MKAFASIAVIVTVSLASVSVLHAQATDAAPGYKNKNLPVERRVADLLSRMTLEEKVAQTLCIWRNDRLFNADGTVKPGAAELVKNGIGEIARISQEVGPREGALRANTLQKVVMESSRLGIPAIFHDEGLHGLMTKGSTNFPQAMALAGTWDPELAGRVFTAVALESRARGVSHLLTPVLDLARDPRWGRTEETYGEDPYLVTRMGVACIRALQGAGPFVDDRHVAATAKHFAAHGQPEGGLNQGPGNWSERLLRSDFLAPFEAVVKEAGVMSLMPSYNEIDGLPSHANRWLLVKLLREEWGFEGFIVGDYSGVAQLHDTRFVARDRHEAAKRALDAGVDIDLPTGACFETLVEQVRDGRVSEAAVDRAASRVLRAKFLLGLFDNPYVDADAAEKVTNSPEHRALALEAARKSITLLKNDGGLLPFDRTKIKKLAVVGPNAAGVHTGGYSWEPREGVSILDGIRAKAGKTIEVRYAEGCRLTGEEATWFRDSVTTADPALDARLIREAVKVVKGCDAAILCIGENETLCREAWAKNHLGDRPTLDLFGRQEDLVRAVLGTGVPTVVFLTNGRSLSITMIAERVPAIVEGWYLGQEGGIAAAEALFGDINPGGKLPITFPRSVGHIPAYYNHKPVVGIDYLFESSAPLFPFGWGLSYTTFRFGNLRVSPARILPAGKAMATVDVTNTGAVAGDEVVQLYIRDVISSVTRPVMELKGFERIHLKPGEKRTVTFEIGPDALALWNEHMERVVEPGEFRVMVGPNSRDTASATLEVADR